MADAPRSEAMDGALEAARKAVDEAWGMDRDHRATGSLDTGRSWVEAYRRLLAYDLGVKQLMQERLEDLPPPMRREIEETNLPIIDGQIQRVRTRLKFWQERVEQLQGSEGSPTG